MKIKTLLLGNMQTNGYVVSDENHHCLIIDPGANGKKVVHYLTENELVPEAVLLTHGHFDHIMGIDSILENWNIPVYVEEEDLPIMTDPELNLSSSYTNGYSFDGAKPLKDGQKLELAGETIEVIHTPGHTMGGCCYYLPVEHAVFSGDTLFQRSVGRTDFPNSSQDAIVRSVRERLFALPDDTIVYPGHMGETKIEYEKLHNPYVQEG